MPRLTDVQTTFASGELDPSLRGQHDLKAYRNGARRVRDMARRSTGGVERRPGTYDLNALVGRSRLAEFEFSATQRFVLVFGAGRVDIYDLNGVFVDVQTGAPWNEQQAFELTYTQTGDTMILCHQGWQPWRLVRTSATTFRLLPFGFDISIDGQRVWQPYYKFVPATTSLTPSAATGTITLTADADVFVAGHIGLRFRIYDCEVIITGVTDARTAAATVQGALKGKLDLDPFKTTAGSATVEVLHLYHGLSTGSTITLSGANAVGGITPNGTFVVTVIDDIRYSIQASAAATASEDKGGASVQFTVAGTKTRAWMEPSISPVRGYPAACSFHEGRLWLGGTASQPDGRWGSNTFQPYRFDVGKGYDAESVQGAIGSEDTSTVQHIVSNGALQYFTALAESINVTRDGEAITPNNDRVKRQSSAGIGRVQPVIFDGATLFVQENGLSVSELTYSAGEDGYVATPISTLAGHLIAKPVSVASASGSTSRAEQFAFFVNSVDGAARSDVVAGSMAVFHSMRSENIAGWALWTLGAGQIQSVAAIGPNVFMCVKVRNAFRLYRLADVPIVSLDGSVQHVAAVAKTNWTLDARVRGREVGIVSELGYHGMFTIAADGVLVLDTAVGTVVAGDPFYFELETLPPIVTVPAGERTGNKMRIVKSIVDFDEAYAVTVNGRRIETRMAGDNFEAAVRPVQGQTEVRHLGFSRDPTTVISQTEPLPGRVLSISQEVKV